MRFISPSFLCFALVVGMLPLVEIRCEKFGTPLQRSIVTQNAFQMAMGETSMSIPRQPGKPNQMNDRQAKEKKTTPAPLLGVWIGCVLLGSIVGFSVPARNARLVVMTIAALGAGGSLLAQTLMGFPLMKEDISLPSIQRMAQEAGVNDAELFGPDFVYTHGYTSAFYVVLLCTAGGVIGVLVDGLNPPKQRPWEEEEENRPRRRPQQRRREDDEDYHDEDDDDRQRIRDRGR
jgi:hypothetical protein